MIGEIAIRFALAIVLDAAAFIVWDVGTRPPLRLIADMARGVRNAGSLMRGVLRFIAGLVMLVAAFVIARPGFPTSRSFLLLQTGMLIAALIVENLIGPDVRSRTRRAASR